MTAEERKRFIVEKPMPLKEIGARLEYQQFYDLLRQT
jgi:hypothetical protein